MYNVATHMEALRYEVNRKAAQHANPWAFIHHGLIVIKLAVGFTL